MSDRSLPSSSSVGTGTALEGGGDKTVRRSRRVAAKKDPELPEAVRRFAAGEVTVHELALERGVSNRAIYKWMLSGIGDDRYGALITDVLVAKIERADTNLEAAEDGVDVAKWSQLGKFARMDFERRRPALYGSKPVTLNVAATVVDSALAESMEKLLDKVAGARLVGGSDASDS